MTFIVATNVIASRPPKRRPTGTPHARANRRQRDKNRKSGIADMIMTQIVAANCYQSSDCNDVTHTNKKKRD